jgi:hypothetical protein
MPKKKSTVEPPPSCATCGKPAVASLYVRFEPYEEARLPAKERYNERRIDRGWSIHLPICTACSHSCVSIGVKLDVKHEERVWAHLDPPAK